MDRDSVKSVPVHDGEPKKFAQVTALSLCALVGKTAAHWSKPDDN